MTLCYREKLEEYGSDILASPRMQSEKQFLQHGSVTVYDHSLAVADLCLAIAERFKLEVDECALVRGALLHDYFLYDWHIPDKSHRLHGFTHAMRALHNAEQEFDLGPIERDMIRCHMFPLNLRIPFYRESAILCIADKLCAARETFSLSRFRICAP